MAEQYSLENPLYIIKLDGKPIPAMSPRKGKSKWYNPRFVDMQYTRWKIQLQHRLPALTGPVAVNYHYVFPIPSSWPKHKREAALSGDMLHISKPDYDNLDKYINDCIKGIVIADDALICSPSHTPKHYGPTPYTELRIWPAKSVTTTG